MVICMTESVSQRNSRLREMRRKYGLGEFKKGKISIKQSKRGESMVRRYVKRSRSRGVGGGLNIKKLAIAALVGVGLYTMTGNKLAGAAGGFIAGGPIGAGLGYFAPEVSGMVSGVLGGVVGGSRSTISVYA